MTRLHRRQVPEPMIDIADRLAPYVDHDTDPKRGVRLLSLVTAKTDGATEPVAVAL